MELSY